ncbi:MAG: hypothetical protein EBR82_11730 [Caulobacteraceae bacterium]|nr:hypothetical protein [Caulobacteraceae bacterium]
MTSQTEKDKRIDAIADWIIDGVRYSELVAKTCSEWKVCPRTAYSYIGAANAIVRDIRMTMKESLVREVADNLKDTYESARRDNDHSAATGAMRELVKLLGLAEPDKTEVKHDATDPIKALLGEIVNAPDKAQ